MHKNRIALLLTLLCVCCGGGEPEEQAPPKAKPDSGARAKPEATAKPVEPTTTPRLLLSQLADALEAGDTARVALLTVPNGASEEAVRSKRAYLIVCARYMRFVERAREKYKQAAVMHLHAAMAAVMFCVDVRGLAERGTVKLEGDKGVASVKGPLGMPMPVPLVRKKGLWRLALTTRELRRSPLGAPSAAAEKGMLRMIDRCSKALGAFVEAAAPQLARHHSAEKLAEAIAPATIAMYQAFPALDMANRSNCKSNLKQLGLGLILYRDNIGKGRHYPPLKRLLTTLYTAEVMTEPEVFLCPSRSAASDDAVVMARLKKHDAKAIGYAWTPYPIRTLRGASRRPVAWDRKGNHLGLRNVLFLDGHVESVKEARFEAMMRALAAQDKKLESEGSPPKHKSD